MVSRETPPLPPWLAPATDLLDQYVELLAGPGVERGLLGPREVPRLWTRHVLNCAVVADPAAGLVVEGSRCADVGSGAGLPGIVWALARPDLDVTLVEPLLRRATFLTEVVDRLGIAGRVRVRRERAESWRPEAGFDIATARAVAPLSKLIGWTLPLLRPGGRLLALKGQSAAEEIKAATPIARKAGLVDLRITTVGAGVVDPPTTVITGRRAQ